MPSERGALPTTAAATASASTTKATSLSVEEIAALKFIREEEKLAHDVYVTLYDQWGLPIFQNIAIVRRGEAHSAPVRVDPDQIRQVLLNLVVNAAEAMEGRGTLTLTTRLTDGGRAAELDITDTGCGISRENLEQLFEPFFTTKEGHGTGLGLSISRGIIENHGGHVWVESTPGQGTTFSIRLPLADAQALAEATTP